MVFEYFDKATAPMIRTNEQVSSLVRSLQRMQSWVSKLGKGADVAGKAGRAIGEAARPGVEFEQSMANISAATGITGGDLQKLGEAARQTGIASGLGAAGAADVFSDLASRVDVSKVGIDGLIELQGRTVTLAQASGMSIPDAASSVADTINQFGLQSGQAGRIINVLAAGSKYGSAGIGELSESLRVVGSAAGGAGLSVESTAGAVEVLSRCNLKGADAGEALRGVIESMQEGMGIDFNTTSLEDAFMKLKPHLQDAAYMSGLFGEKNASAAQYLAENADVLKEMTDRITGTNTATEQAAIRTGTWSQRLKVQAAQVNDWAVGIQQGFGGTIGLFQSMGQGYDMLLKLSPVGKMFVMVGKNAFSGCLGIVRFVRTVRMLSLAKEAMSAFGFARAVASCGTMGRVAAVSMNLWSKVTKMAGFVQGGLATVLKGVRMVMMTSVLPALSGAIAATWAWTAALLANPITWIVLAIGALVAAVVVCWQRFAGFRAVVLTIWDAVKGFGMAIWNYMITPLKAVWAILSGLGRAIVKLFSGDFKGAAEEFTGAFKDGFTAGVEGFKKSIEGVRDTVGGISGNYEAHLVEERAKQAEKDKKKEDGDVAGAVSGFVMPEVAVPQGDMPALDFSGGEVRGAGMPEPGVRGIAADRAVPDRDSAKADVEGAALNRVNVAELIVAGINIPKVDLSRIAGVGVHVPRIDVAGIRPGKAVPEKSGQAAAEGTAGLTPAPVREAEKGKTPGISGKGRAVAGRYEVTRGGGLPEARVPHNRLYGAVPAVRRDKVPEVTVKGAPLAAVPPEGAYFPSFQEVRVNNTRTFSGDVLSLEKQMTQITGGAMNASSGHINAGGRPADPGQGIPAKIEVNFQPTVNISAEMTEKAKQDFLSTLRSFAGEVTALIEDVQRQNGRGAYAIS